MHKALQSAQQYRNTGLKDLYNLRAKIPEPSLELWVASHNIQFYTNVQNDTKTRYGCVVCVFVTLCTPNLCDILARVYVLRPVRY